MVMPNWTCVWVTGSRPCVSEAVDPVDLRSVMLGDETPNNSCKLTCKDDHSLLLCDARTQRVFISLPFPVRR